MKSFKDIPKELCHFCGACVSVCPVSCLENGYEKIKENPGCIQCGLCYDICPGINLDFKSINRRLFKNNKYSNCMGFYKNLYNARSKETEILQSSSSGGLVAPILSYAFDKKIIDAAIILSFNPINPTKHKIELIESKSGLKRRTTSRYYMIPLVSFLKDIKPKYKKIAIVGLPCHIHAIRKMQNKNYKPAKSIKLIIGLFCGFNISYDATKFLLNSLKIKESEVKHLSYRHKGWPGNFYVKKKNGKEYNIPKKTYDYLNYVFIPDRCLLCPDFTNEFADISLGDAWRKRKSKYGWSDVIVRTNIGEEIISGLIKRKELNIEEVSPKELLASHKGNINFKKKGTHLRLKSKKIKPKYIFNNKPKLSFKYYIKQSFVNKSIKFLRWSPIKSIILIFNPNLAGKVFNTVKNTIKSFIR